MKKSLLLTLSFLCFALFQVVQSNAQCSISGNACGFPCPAGGGCVPGLFCCQSPILCSVQDLDGYVGGTPPANAQGIQWCTSVENIQFVGFIATGPSINFTVTPNNCSGGGIQVAVFQGDCDGPFIICTSPGVVQPVNVNLGGLQIGEIYFIAIDGFAGSICGFEIDVIQAGPNITNLGPATNMFGPGITPPATLCPGTSGSYFTPPVAGAACYNWTVLPPGPTLSLPDPNNPGPVVNIVWNDPGSYQLCVQPENPCVVPSPPPLCRTVLVLPIPPTTVNLPPLCIGDCVDFFGFQACTPGLVPVDPTPQSQFGCDSLVFLLIPPAVPGISVAPYRTVCAPTTYNFFGQILSTSGGYQHVIDNGNWRGCDSTIVQAFCSLNPLAAIAPPSSIGCGNDTCTVLNATASNIVSDCDSTVVTYAWTASAGGAFSGPTNTLQPRVCRVGTYTLTVTFNRRGVICTSTRSVNVNDNIVFPASPVFASGPTNACAGSVQRYCITAVQNATSYTWTVPPGATFVLANGGLCADVTFGTTSGNVCVTAVGACGNSQPTCRAVTVNAPPVVPAFSGLLNVCLGDIESYTLTNNVNPPAAVNTTYNWTVPPGASFTGQGTRTISVNFTGATSGQICLTVTNVCGTQTHCENVTITNPPVAPPIPSGPGAICANATGTYTIAPVAGATGYTWTASGGATITPSGTSATVVMPATAGTVQVCVTATNGCGNSPQTCLPVTVNPAPNGIIANQGVNELCAGSPNMVNIRFTFTGTPPFNATYTINSGTPQVITGIATSTYTLMTNTPGNYVLTVVNDATGCTGTFSGTATVIENPLPTASISGNGSICEGTTQTAPLTVTLTGEAPFRLVYAIGGVSQAPVTGITGTTYTIQATAPGNYTIVSIEDNNGCVNTGSGTSTVVENTAPIATFVTDSCNITNTAYTVIFTITGGDPSSYTVSPAGAGTLTTSPPYTYTSNPIASGLGYNFEIFDANSCDTAVISRLIKVCNCTTRAGVMNNTTIRVCGTGPAVATYDDTNQVFDGDDMLEFVLHTASGPAVGTVITRSATPSFSFVPPMVYGTTYYISAIVGNNVGGSVDLNDPCLQVAQGTPVIFYRNPVADISGTTDICEGEDTDLTINFTTGVGPFSIAITGAGIADTLTGITGSTYLYNVNPTVTTTYTITDLNTNFCPGTFTGSATVTVHDSPVIDSTDVICNSTSTEFTIVVYLSGGDPSTYSFAGNIVTAGVPGAAITGNIVSGVFTSDPILADVGFHLEFTDQWGCPAVEYDVPIVICNCLSEVGTMQTTRQEICGNGPINASTFYNMMGQNLDGDDVFEYILHTNPGLTIGNVIQRNTTGSFSFIPPMVLNTTYYVSAVVGNDNGSGQVNLTDFCLAVSPGLPIRFHVIPTLNLAGDTSICIGNATNIIANLTGDAPYEIVYSDGTTNTTVSNINNVPRLISVSPTVTTTYTPISVQDEFCPGTVSGSAVVDVNVAPVASNVQVVINSTNTDYQVCFDITGGEAPYVVTPAGSLTGSTYCTDFTACPQGGPGTYTISVDDNNNCGPQVITNPVICNCDTEVGVMDQTRITICGTGAATAIYDDALQVFDGNDTLCYFLFDSARNVIASNSTAPTFSFDPATMMFGTTYFISAVVGDHNGSGCVDLNDFCLAVAPGTPVVWRRIPTAAMSGTATICRGASTNITITLGGTGPWNVTYTVGGTPTTLTGVTTSPIVIPVTPTNSTNYGITSVSTSFCPGTTSGFANVTVNTPPVPTTPTYTCNSTNTTYTATFTINGGLPGTYTVNGTPITGSTYTSAPITNGEPFSFAVNDGNGCGPVMVTGSNLCPCTSDAGNMGIAVQRLCANTDLNAVNLYDGFHTFDGNDGLMFILHTTNTTNIANTTVLASNTTGIFNVNSAALTFGTTYYVSAVVGNLLPNGLVSLTDACLSLSNAQPVVFSPMPTALISGDATICNGTSTVLTFALTGNAPYNVNYQDNFGNMFMVTIPNGHTINVSPTVNTTYTVTQISAGSNPVCTSTVNDNAIVNVSQPVDAGVANAAIRLCRGGNQVINLAGELTGETAGGIWSETSTTPSSGGAFSAINGTFNVSNQAAGTYTFRYFLDAAAPCPDDSETVTITLDPIPNADAGTDQEITCFDTNVDLGGTNTSTGANLDYYWIGPLGDTISNSANLTSQTVGGNYSLFVYNNVSNCFSVDEVVVDDTRELPVPEIVVSPIVCFGEDNGAIFIQNVTGGEAPYLFSINGGPFSTQTNFLNLQPGNFNILVQDANGCEFESQLDVTQPNLLQVILSANLGENNTILLGDSITLNAQINVPWDSITSIQWEPREILPCDTCQSIMVYPTNQTTFMVTIQDVNGCTATDLINVFVKKEKPIYVPTAFSPGNGGVTENDRFTIYAKPGIVKNINKFLIFSRWGETVFEGPKVMMPGDATLGWDGKHRGEYMNPAVFTWYAEIEFIDGKIEFFEGDVTLVR